MKQNSSLGSRRGLREKVIITIFVLLLFLVFIGCIKFADFLKSTGLFRNDTEIVNIAINDYVKDEYVDLTLKVNNKQVSCAFSESDNAEKDDLSFSDMNGSECSLNIPFKAGYVYFMDEKGVMSKAKELNNYVVDFGVKDKYYLALDDTDIILEDVVAIGEPKLNVVSSNEGLILNGYSFSANSKVNSVLTISNGDVQSKNIEVVVTDVIVKKPQEFNFNKNHLTCHAYTEEEAKLLDEILASRVNDAGYGTRAGAVAASRFLTLEFPYRINYFYENGRLSGESGRNYVDGEGRYYHFGLYLSDSKFEEIEASLSGPSIWGCPLTNWEDNEDRGFYPGVKVPNGLDCSGYVSWNVHNGGFEPGDIGAGLSYVLDMTDLGDYTRLTYDLIESGKVKPGDLLSIDGHIAFITGIDDDNIYVAESLSVFKGVVLNKYSKKAINKTFPYVVLMDDFYKEDGNLTYMWY